MDFSIPCGPALHTYKYALRTPTHLTSPKTFEDTASFSRLPNNFFFLSLMGNYISCTLSAPPGKHSRAPRVIFPTGEIRQFDQPVKAAELMLEMPNFFLVNSRSLHMGRRFSALNADEDLEMANVYVMFPMKRLNSVVTAADVGVLFLTAKRVSGGNGRLSPEPATTTEAAAPNLNLDEMEEFSTPEFKHRLSMCRSKKPLLETIAEEPIYSR